MDDDAVLQDSDSDIIEIPLSVKIIDIIDLSGAESDKNSSTVPN